MIGKRLLPILFLLLVACSTKSGQRAAGDNLFGNVQESAQVTEEITFVEPDGEDGDATTVDGEGGGVDETLPCDQISILSLELPEAMAGEEYRFPISIQSNCQQVGCSLVAAPEGTEWVELNGCELNGIPASDEALAGGDVRVRVFGHDHETTFEERTFTLIVRDEPSIILFPASLDLGEKMKKGIGGANGKEENVYSITLGRHALYARIQGYADSYEVNRPSNRILSIEELGPKLYRILPEENVLAANQDERLFSDINLTAVDEFGNSAQRTFDLHIFRNPCDQDLTITQLDTWREIDYADLEEDQVVLGSKYRLVLQVTGGEGPYEWDTPKSAIVSSVEESCILPSDIPYSDDEFSFGCSDNVLVTNPNWHEITPEDEAWDLIGPDLDEEALTQKSFFQLETDFSFPGKDLPFNAARDNDIFDQLSGTVRSETCTEERGEPFEATYTESHQLIPPAENIAGVTCTQEMREVGDTGDDSRMWIIFKHGETAVASIEYNINECKGEENEHNCEDPKTTTILESQFSNLDQIDGVEIVFADETDFDDFCIWDCDHDQAEYNLDSITCKSNFQILYWSDEQDGAVDINDQVVPSENGWTISDIPVVGRIPYVRNFGATAAQGVGLEARSYHLELNRHSSGGIWFPRVRPEYPDSN